MSFTLSREVRFALNDRADDQLQHPPTNSFAGYPSMTGFSRFVCVRVTLAGELDARSSYLCNIKEIDRVVRTKVIGGPLDPASVFKKLQHEFSGRRLSAVSVALSPYLSLHQLAGEYPMSTRLSQKFEFSASHRLHNPQLNDEENRRTYGKCNNPNGHGHNYEVQVTVRGTPDAAGLLVEMPRFEKIVSENVIEKLDHRNLNADVSEFRSLIPSVENISMVIYRMLKHRLSELKVDLASVTVWETPKTWCEYTED
jgi:6-pyruvoyltetrahydropterin/6-carboxytetrahydropterin synthase